ncbi:MAG: DUF4142 domain-containing protein [Novosphingobium sp.]|nr:DUF4142 domain-containing protein [Novosphingobium sp.]
MRYRFLALALSFAAALPAAALAAPPGAFLDDAIRGDNGEIEIGRFVQQHGFTAGVRRFGQQLAHDHAMARSQAVAAAQRLNVPVPDGVTPEQAALRDRLARLRGRAFDQTFAHAMVDDHRKDIAKFVDQARSRDPVTSRLARATLPHLRQHLRIAESLAH